MHPHPLDTRLNKNCTFGARGAIKEPQEFRSPTFKNSFSDKASQLNVSKQSRQNTEEYFEYRRNDTEQRMDKMLLMSNNDS